MEHKEVKFRIESHLRFSQKFVPQKSIVFELSLINSSSILFLINNFRLKSLVLDKISTEHKEVKSRIESYLWFRVLFVFYKSWYFSSYETNKKKFQSTKSTWARKSRLRPLKRLCRAFRIVPIWPLIGSRSIGNKMHPNIRNEWKFMWWTLILTENTNFKISKIICFELLVDLIFDLIFVFIQVWESWLDFE